MRAAAAAAAVTDADADADANVYVTPLRVLPPTHIHIPCTRVHTLTERNTDRVHNHVLVEICTRSCVVAYSNVDTLVTGVIN